VKRLGCILLIVALIAAVYGGWQLRGWWGPGPATRTTTVQIAEGTSLARAATTLEKAGVIRSAAHFRLFARLFGGKDGIKAGEYRFRPRESAAQILAELQGGRTFQRLVTIPEGWPSVMVADLLNKAPELTGPPVAPPAEGSVLPDSYAYSGGDTRAAVLARMQAAMKRYLARAWAQRKPGTPVKTQREALILASIVEKETGKPDERRMVAAVYANRLKQGMPLQADPTVIYPVTKGRPLGRRILLSELRAKNGYNTYAETGLPKGPICNPGRASIDAALNPAASRALYFVADGSGGHVFADTLDQHNANVAKWRAYRAAHGI